MASYRLVSFIAYATITCSTHLEDYKVLWSGQSAHGTVQVVKLNTSGGPVSLMVCDHTVIGAQFLDGGLREQTLFEAFDIQRSLQYLQPQPKRALVLGLGMGMAPSTFRRAGILTDVVEINKDIVRAATTFYNYDATSTTVADARSFILSSRPENSPRYDLVLHDLFSDSMAMNTLSVELVRRVRNDWLEERGVFAVNFVGVTSTSKHGIVRQAFWLSLAVARTLRAVFSEVHCYKEAPLAWEPERPWNVLCLASTHPWDLKLPTEARNKAISVIPEMSPLWYVHNFRDWEILTPTEPEFASGQDIITEHLNPTAFGEAWQFVKDETFAYARESLMPQSGFWPALELQIANNPASHAHVVDTPDTHRERALLDWVYKFQESSRLYVFVIMCACFLCHRADCFSPRVQRLAPNSKFENAC